MDFREIGYEGADWVHLTHSKVQWQASVNVVMIIEIP